MSTQQFQGKVEFLDSVEMGEGTLESHRVGVEALTAAVTLKTSDSGKVFTLGSAGGFTVTLPAAASATGWTARFYVKVAPTTAYIIAGGTADLMVGTVHSSTGGNADSETTAGADQVNFVADTSLIGDRVDIVCDGTHYYVQGFCDADGGITLTG